MSRKQVKYEIKYPKVKQYFVQQYARYVNMMARRTGEVATQKEFADYLGVELYSLSQWFIGRRKPTDAWQHVIAEKLGPGIYDACDTPARMPETGELRSIVRDWYNLEPEQQEAFLRQMREQAEANQREQQGSDAGLDAGEENN